MTLKEIAELGDRYLERLAQVTDEASLEVWYRQVLARSGAIATFKKRIGKLPKDTRSGFGREVNALSSKLQAAFEAKRSRLEDDRISQELATTKMDVTLPSRPQRYGRLHPVTVALREACEIFQSMGFHVFDSPHVELDEYNFQLLNIPKHHPARDMQDTFYVNEDVVLRTHMSPGQIRAMRAFAPAPCQVVLPGLCYRYENITPRSEIQFHQIEGLLVGPYVRFSDLKGVLLRFARSAYGEDQRIRLRGSYFPFTEPSVEIDIYCTLCHGGGCRVCKQSGWLEMGGAGLVHPVVLQNGGYSTTEARGIAFGMGIERSILLRHGVKDIRRFFQNDLRFLRQFT